jgi:hypothetical protein
MRDLSDSLAADRRPGEGRGPISRREPLGPGLRRDDASKAPSPPTGWSFCLAKVAGFPLQPARECLRRGPERHFRSVDGRDTF